MDNLPIKTFQFRAERLADIPFEIVPIQELPPIATKSHPSRRTFYALFWVTDGTGTHHIDFETWLIAKNTLHFVTPGQVAFWEFREQVTGYALLFTPDFIAINLAEQISLQSFDFFHPKTKHPVVQINENEAHTFNTLCKHMLGEYISRNYGRVTLLQCQLLSFLIHAQRYYPQSPQLHSVGSTAEQLVTQYIQLVEKYFRDIQSVQVYAHQLNITSGYLRDIIQRQLGTTPVYLLNQRIALEAKRMLMYSEQTIAQIGHALNFDDPSYFSRFFKREAGATPSEFRHEFREKYQLSRD